jgi:uncharacterized repeat protein (TIGR03843 family)
VPGDERPSQSAGLSDEPPALLRGDIEILGLLPNASNHTLLVRCSDGDDGVLAVYKPRRGEAPLWDFPEGTLYLREVAAYRLARSLGWPNVPPTLVRDGPAGPGSVQLFRMFDPEQHFFTLEDERPEEFRRVALFDLVANNADRKAGHCLLSDDGRIWAIDHGVCFSDEPKLRTVIWSFAGDPIEDGLRGDLERVARSLDPGGDLRGELEDLLATTEVDATADRARELVRTGRFPEPIPGTRPFPWPPI